MQDSYLSALQYLDDNVADILRRIDPQKQKSIQEIRLRTGLPLSVYINNEIFFVNTNSHLSKNSADSIIIPIGAVSESVRKITGNSVYSHLGEIESGFISMPSGNRAGISGVFRQGKFCEATSLNIRIAQEHKGVAVSVVNSYSGGSVLICGPPTSGKTTFLRDLIRGLSNGDSGRFYKISVIDTRCEIAAKDVGINTDVFFGRDKAEGIEAAIRSMSPDIVAFDEIGTIAELEAVKSSINCGTYIITTAHIGSTEELYKRNVTRALLEDCAIERVIFLKYAGCEPVNMQVRDGKICY